MKINNKIIKKIEINRVFKRFKKILKKYSNIEAFFIFQKSFILK